MRTSEISFRQIRPQDQEFLFRIYAGTRADVEAAGLGVEEKNQFLRMQFAAQSHYYAETFPDAEFRIIVYKGQAVGRLYIDRPGDEIHVIDIALLPDYRQKGIGSSIMTEILKEATQSSLPVRIYVEHYNTALAWYESLGFEKVEDIQTHFRMKWQSDQETPSLNHPQC